MVDAKQQETGMTMIKYLHTMVRVRDIEESKKFYCDLLGLEEVKRFDNEAGKFTLVFLAPPGQPDAMIELTHNWDSDEIYTGGRNFGHLAYRVDDIYATLLLCPFPHVLKPLSTDVSTKVSH